MVAYSFKRRFVNPIRVGLGLAPYTDRVHTDRVYTDGVHGRDKWVEIAPKRQTIRADRKRHARPGEEVQLYHGMRTRQCFLIGKARCTSVLTAYLSLDRPYINIGGVRCRDTHGFARKDGFEDWDDMLAFWREEHPGSDSFTGVIIFWEPISDDPP